MHFEPNTVDSWYNLPRQGGVAYAAQESWVQNETIRENILFGSPYDEERYQKGVKPFLLLNIWFNESSYSYLPMWFKTWSGTIWSRRWHGGWRKRSYFEVGPGLLVSCSSGRVLTLQSNLPVEGRRYVSPTNVMSQRLIIFDDRHGLLLLEQSTHQRKSSFLTMF